MARTGRPKLTLALFWKGAVLGALASWLQAGVVVAPGKAVIAAGGTCVFKAALTGEPELQAQEAAGWHWRLLEGPGDLDASTGLYRAPADTAASILVQAELLAVPGLAGLASGIVLPLPHPLPELISEVLGAGWVDAYSMAFPFLDPETGRRGDSEVRPKEGPAMKPNGQWAVGYGIPFGLSWTPTRGYDACRLTYREGGQWVRQDLSTTQPQTLTVACHGKVDAITMEGLRSCGQAPEVLETVHGTSAADVRGLLPFCGNLVAPAGHQDGTGFSARFRRPFGLALLRGAGLLLVTDPLDHVLRTVNRAGEVGTLCGQPGEAGSQDSPTWRDQLASVCGPPPGQPALFRGPTYLAVRNVPARWPASRAEEVLVADSGNHVIRRVRRDGTVRTLAGTKGLAGHRDALDPARAVFNDPQGLAVAPDGTVYVADRRNQVIRWIAPNGRVGTLAGRVQVPGVTDGLPPFACFTHPQGLCLDPERQALYVLDGHALRRIQLPRGEVTTLLGVVNQPGFVDIDNRSRLTRAEAVRLPCLNHPTSLVCHHGQLYLADHGNHAVRRFDPVALTLETLAGDPGQGATRYGLVRDGLPGPLDASYAALDNPGTLVVNPWDKASEGLLLTSGPCVAELRHEVARRDQPVLVPDQETKEAVVGQDCTTVFTLLSVPFMGEAASSPAYITADYLDPDGTSAFCSKGWTEVAGRIVLKGSFTLAGRGKIRVRAVTTQGVSTWAEVPVRIR